MNNYMIINVSKLLHVIILSLLMKKLFTLPNLYVLLWALYNTQGIFVPVGSIWSRSILVVFLLISLYFFVKVFGQKQSQYFKALGMLLGMFTVYGAAHIIVGGGVRYLQNIYLSLMPIYMFFVLTKEGKIDENWIRVVFYFMAGVMIIQYFSAVRYMEDTYGDTENVVINVGYDLASLLPLIYFWKERPIVQYAIFALVVGLIVTTVKRGAIIVSGLCALYFIYNSLIHSTQKTKWYIGLVVLVFVIVGIRYVINFYNNSEYMQLRVDYTMEGDSSGRDYYYSRAWNFFLNSDIMGLLFGHGAYATIRLMRSAAHNDWLELLVNQGLLGATVYLFYWIVFYKTFHRAKNDETQPIMGMVMIIYFVATLFSMSYDAMTLPATLALGYSLAKQQEKRNNIISRV